MTSVRLVARGVYRCPCYDPQGRIVLYAVDHNHCWIDESLGGVRHLEATEDPIEVNDQLWALLNRLDPWENVA
jgi:hypothetical protein